MTLFHAAMTGKHGEDFSISFRADNPEQAREHLARVCPEAQCDELIDEDEYLREGHPRAE